MFFSSFFCFLVCFTMHQTASFFKAFMAMTLLLVYPGLPNPYTGQGFFV